MSAELLLGENNDERRELLPYLLILRRHRQDGIHQVRR